jgi:methyl-accepting chemotaxis protein
VMQLDELTQQNAALVEQASAASQSMAEQARQLNDSMQHYTVAGNGDAAQAPALPSAAAPAVPAPRVERRKADRPWSGRKTAPAAPIKARAPAQVAGDGVWTEF